MRAGGRAREAGLHDEAAPRAVPAAPAAQDIVGTLMFMPLIYPFEPWRIKHNVHHAYTNK